MAFLVECGFAQVVCVDVMRMGDETSVNEMDGGAPSNSRWRLLVDKSAA